MAMHPYNWKPVRQTVVRDSKLGEQLYSEGYAVVDLLRDDELSRLQELYRQLHRIEVKDGGMFYSVYSKDVDYRKRTHAGVNAILADAFSRSLQEYRVVLNAFVIKAPGKKSEFGIHQDSTGLDEFRYSPLSIWIPLVDIDEKNGALCLIPRSHHLFSPYRSISFPAPYETISATVKKYLRPVYLKKGQAIFFDNRLLHNSLNNLSEENRVVEVSSVFPVQAELITCFKNTHDPENQKIELLQHEDDFLLEYSNFLENCHVKPNRGMSIGFVDDRYPGLSSDEFEALCAQQGIRPYETADLFNNAEACNMIGEPVTTE